MSTRDGLEKKVNDIYGCDDSPLKYIVKANGLVEYNTKEKSKKLSND
jgi:hypothetical protein